MRRNSGLDASVAFLCIDCLETCHLVFQSWCQKAICITAVMSLCVVYLHSSWLSYLYFNCSWVRLGTSELSVKSLQHFPPRSERTFVVETFVRQKSVSIWRVYWWIALPQNTLLPPGQLQWRMRRGSDLVTSIFVWILDPLSGRSGADVTQCMRCPVDVFISHQLKPLQTVQS